MSLYHVKSNTVADMTGTITGYDSAGSTTTMAATDLVRPSDWNSVHNVIQNLSGNTLGTSQVSGTDIVWAGGNNITLSASAGGVTVHGSSNIASTHEPAVYVGGAVTAVNAINSNLYARSFSVEDAMAVNAMRFAVSGSQASSTMSVICSVSGGSASSWTNSLGVAVSANLSYPSPTNSTALVVHPVCVLTGSPGLSIYNYNSLSWSTNGSSVTGSYSSNCVASYLAAYDGSGGITYSSHSASGSASFSRTSTNAATFSTSFTNSFMSAVISGLRAHVLPYSPATLTAGVYYPHVGYSQQYGNTSGNGGSASIQTPFFPDLRLVVDSVAADKQRLGKSATVSNALAYVGIGLVPNDSATSRALSAYRGNFFPQIAMFYGSFS